VKTEETKEGFFGAVEAGAEKGAAERAPFFLSESRRLFHVRRLPAKLAFHSLRFWGWAWVTSCKEKAFEFFEKILSWLWFVGGRRF